MKKTAIFFVATLALTLFSCSDSGPAIGAEAAKPATTPPPATTQTPAEYLKAKLETSKHFAKYTNGNGVVTYYMNSYLAGYHHITLYYTTPCITDDGRYIWFWLTDDRGNFDQALYDVEQDEYFHYKGMEVHTSSTYVDTKTGEVYWVKPAENQRYIGDYYYILKRGTDPKDKIKTVARIPHQVDNCPAPRQVVTHLIPSADGKSFCFDSGHYRTNGKSYLGTVPMSVDGQAQLWTILDRRYDHAQMHPVYNDVMLACQDAFTDYAGHFGEAGGRILPTDRIWIVYADGYAAPVFESPNDIYHEWWGAQGKYLWFIDKKPGRAGQGVCRIEFNYSDRTFGAPELIWPNALGHAAGSKSEFYLVGDHRYKSWATTNSCQVSFYNIATKKEVDIYTSMPYSGSMNHPHPCFAMNDAVVCYTFSQPGHNGVGITFTDALIEKSK